IPGWKNVPIVSWLRQAFKLPCRMDNDANAAALAESLWGAGKDYRFVFYATLSTGIGTGLVIDKKLYVGRSGRALEGGHLSIDYKGRQCNCGLKGCIEAYASGPSMVRRALGRLRGLKNPVTPKSILQAAQAGNKKAAHLITETGELLGIWLGNIVNIIEPDVIILGGGITNLGDPLFGPIKKTLPRYSIIPYANKIPVVRAHFESDSGILGAAAIAGCGKSV
ncbi:MAG: ROK family protein, partial [Elusimicrobiota bacterium]